MLAQNGKSDETLSTLCDVTHTRPHLHEVFKAKQFHRLSKMLDEMKENDAVLSLRLPTTIMLLLPIEAQTRQSVLLREAIDPLSWKARQVPNSARDAKGPPKW